MSVATNLFVYLTGFEPAPLARIASKAIVYAIPPQVHDDGSTAIARYHQPQSAAKEDRTPESTLAM